MLHLTVKSFEEKVLQSPIPVLVDFYADWCGPCKMLAPVLEELDTEYDDRVKICKINTDDEPALAAQFNVTSIPTLLFIKDGKIADQSVGFLPKAALAQKLDGLL